MPTQLAPSAADNDLRATLDGLKSHPRLSDLEDVYDGPFFDQAVLRLVREGEISLLAVGEVVVVRRE